MKKRYVVELTPSQRDYLDHLLSQGTHKARKLNRARILLYSDMGKTDEEISTLVGVTTQTIYNIRKRYCEEGFNAALDEKPRKGAPIKLDEKAESYAIALACSDAPEGYTHWTMQMIADKLVELKLVESISDETIRVRLKKRLSNPGDISSGASRS